MAEKIEVRYSEISSGYYHKYIVYTQNDGNRYYARGGPSTGALEKLEGIHSNLLE